MLLEPLPRGGVGGGRLPDVLYPQCSYARASPGCQARSRCSRAPRRPSHWVGGAVRHCAGCAPAPHIPTLHSLEVEVVAVPVSTILRLAVAHQAGRAGARRQNAKRQRQGRRSHDSRAVSPQEPSQRRLRAPAQNSVTRKLRRPFRGGTSGVWRDGRTRLQGPAVLKVDVVSGIQTGVP